MRTKHRLYMWGGLLAGAVALGCQAPAVAPQGAGTPRAVVHFGAVKLEPDADMAIVLNRTDCGEKGYALKQVGPDPRVDHIKVEVTGPGLVDPYTKTITRDAFGGLCDATLNLAGLATGTYSVRFTSYNASGDPVASANGTVNVANGSTSQLNLACNFNLGSLDVNIHCCDAGATPTPLPSASVTPTPVPTPTPTPPPLPVPTTLTSGATGFSVAADGGIFIFAWDPQPGGQVGGGRARILRVNPDLTMPQPTSVFADNTDLQTEGEIKDDWFRGLVNGFPSRAITFDTRPTLPSGTISNVSPSAGATNWHHVANTLNRSNSHLIYTAVVKGRFNGVYVETTKIYEETLTQPLVNVVATDPLTTDYYLPHTMAWAGASGASGAPVWAAFGGVFKPGATASTPQEIVDGPAYGLTLLTEDASELLFTKWGYVADHDIYRFGPDTNGVAVPAMEQPFLNGYPWYLERGADGNLYVMLAESGPTATSPETIFNAASQQQRFRIVKLAMDPVTHRLKPVQLMVDNFANQAPSFLP